MQEYDLHAIWSGGFFEAGGSITTPRNQKDSGYPMVEVHDKVKSHIETFHLLYGFPEPRAHRQEWRSRAVGQTVLDFLAEIYPFAPSRGDAIRVLRKWYCYSSDTRKEICELMPDIRRIPMPYTAYESLIQDPSFVAGVLDSRGGFYHLSKLNPEQIQLIVVSQNKGLMHALSNQYGGKFYPSVFATRHDPTVNHRSWSWRVNEREQLKHIIEVVGPFMRNQDILEKTSVAF